MPSFLRSPKFLIALGVAALALAGGAVAAYLIVTKKPGDVTNTGVEFTMPAPETATVPPPEEKEKPKRKRPRTVNWPRYGYTLQHTRNFQPERVLNGPWRKDWVHQVRALTEFPPVIWKGRIFHLIDDGELVSVKASNGRRRWTRRVGALAASSPAVDAEHVYVVLLERSSGSGQGRVMALRQSDGRIRWSKVLPSRSESSPLVIGNRLYFGSEDGTVYAMDKRSGRVIWRYRANGAVKGSPTFSDGKLYFGNYGGDVQAIRASDGKLVWRNGAGVANFYATAAVAYGRVYIGNTDGRLYSFSARSGALAWARQTGGYVYSSAAIHTVPRVGPTVFVGSYDGHFYAFDARTGDVRWRHDAGGRISGSPTVIGNTVYFANLAKRETVGLNTRSGRRVFHRWSGSFDPIVSDGEKLYLTGSSSLTALRQVSTRHR